VPIRERCNRIFAQVFPETTEINISHLHAIWVFRAALHPEVNQRPFQSAIGVFKTASIPPQASEGKEGRMISIERIRNVDIFQGLKDEELKITSQYCQEEKVPEGTMLCEEGGRADKLFILEEGIVSIRLKKGMHFEIHGPGKILGWSFLVPPSRYTASAVTVTPSSLLTIKSPDFYDLVHKDTKVGLRIMDNLSQIVSSRLKAFVDYY
jgi:CRP/FNR family cyclic AMP-dependent transcriptional regulator